MIWINILIGLVLLIAGRRLFWLFVACVGFAQLESTQFFIKESLKEELVS